MIRHFRLLELEENRNVKYDLPILIIKLSEINPATFNDTGYFFPIYDGEMFVFLDTPGNNSYFLENPEEVKSLDMNQFFEGNMLISGQAMKTFDHWKYVEAIRQKKKILDGG
jgi:hypothetical protein